MFELNYKIKLTSGNAERTLTLECLYLVQINFTFNLFIRSGDFSGVTKGFCVRKDQVQELVHTLENIYRNRDGLTELTDFDSDSFIKFSKNEYGNLEISGLVGSGYGDHHMVFKFEFELSAIPQFVNDLKELLSFNDLDWNQITNRI